MVQIQTLLKVADNSGGKVVRCLKILKKGHKTRYGRVGDTLVVSVQQIRSKNKLTSKVKKGDVLLAVLVKTRTFVSHRVGSSFSFTQNSVVLLDKEKKNKPLATRVIGLIPRQLRSSKFSKIVSLSAGVI
jgi:large subunit ribosomal protein L14